MDKPKTVKRGMFRDITAVQSDGHDECAACSTKLSRGQKYASVELQLLHSGDSINLCLLCVAEAAIVLDAAQFAIDIARRRKALGRLVDGNAA